MAIIKRQYRKKNQQKPARFYRVEVYIKGIRVSASSRGGTRYCRPSGYKKPSGIQEINGSSCLVV